MKNPSFLLALEKMASVLEKKKMAEPASAYVPCADALHAQSRDEIERALKNGIAESIQRGNGGGKAANGTKVLTVPTPSGVEEFYEFAWQLRSTDGVPRVEVLTTMEKLHKNYAKALDGNLS